MKIIRQLLRPFICFVPFWNVSDLVFFLILVAFTEHWSLLLLLLRGGEGGMILASWIIYVFSSKDSFPITKVDWINEKGFMPIFILKSRLKSDYYCGLNQLFQQVIETQTLRRKTTMKIQNHPSSMKMRNQKIRWPQKVVK